MPLPPTKKNFLLPALICAASMLGGKGLFHAASARLQPHFVIPQRLHNTNEIKNNRERCQPLMGIKGFRKWFESAFPSSLKKVQHELSIKRAKSSSAAINNRNNKSSSNSGTHQHRIQPETYDHVLIDANQFLHSNLRKAFNRKLKRSKGSAQFDGQNLDDDFIEYSLLLLLQDLNRLTSTVAIPRKSLVVAIDGSPGAAKLEMQRRRRFGLYKKVESQQKLLKVLKDRGWNDSHFGFFDNKDKKGENKHITLLSKHEREKVTMNITPGTPYLDRVTDALLYWAWRSVANPYWPVSTSSDKNNNNKQDGRVKIYISPSMVPGEGEIKLLDFMMRGQSNSERGRKTIQSGDSVAFIGGDSDLVLMGLASPTSVTENIHVILPGENSMTLMISISETTRHLVAMIEGTALYGKRMPKWNKKKRRHLNKKEIQQARMDAVALIVLNGNDYLPKLRHSGPFDSFFDVYLILMEKCLTNCYGDNSGEKLEPFLINIHDNGATIVLFLVYPS